MINIAEFEKKFNSLNKFNLVFASFFFSLMTLCVKNIDKRIPIYELVLFRSLLSLMITLYIINLKDINPWGKNRPLLILRGLLGTLALVCIFYAIRNMPLSISTVIQYTYPIFISIFLTHKVIKLKKNEANTKLNLFNELNFFSSSAIFII